MFVPRVLRNGVGVFVNSLQAVSEVSCQEQKDSLQVKQQTV